MGKYLGLSRPCFLGLLGLLVGLAAGVPAGYAVKARDGGETKGVSARNYRKYAAAHAELRADYLAQKETLVGRRGLIPKAQFTKELHALERDYRDAYRSLRVSYGLPPDKPGGEDLEHWHD
jgi:hypothetical protein